MDKLIPGDYKITKILTDSDFDGLVCGTIAKIVYPDAKVLLGDASNLNQGKFDYFVDDETMICDLKYIQGAGLHFDHHVGNLTGVPDHLGKYYAEDSAARIMYDFYKDKYDLSNIGVIIEDVDKQDSGKISLLEYTNPSNAIRFATVVDRNDHDFIYRSIEVLVNSTFVELFKKDFVRDKVERVHREREGLKEYIKANTKIWNSFAFIDLFKYDSKNKVNSFVVSAEYPNTHGTIILKKGSISTKDDQLASVTKISFYSNSFNPDRIKINYVEIAKELSDNAGGHPGACGFVLDDGISREEIVEAIKGKLRKYI